MPKKLASITIRGKHHTWCFDTYIDPQYLEEWRDDEVHIELIENTIPVWVADFGLVRPWCFMQDVFNFRNPWRGGP